MDGERRAGSCPGGPDIETGEIAPFEIRLATSLRGENIIIGRPRWLHGGKVLAFIALDEQGRTGVYAQDFVPGEDTSSTRRALAGFLPEVTTESFGISPDGRRVTLAVMEQTKQVMLAEAVTGVEPPR